MAAATAGADVVHTHTWYANLGGHLAKVLHGIPHVMTTHSLEPRRPWKAEQLGAGYGLSSWAEKTAIEAADAVIAVSAGMRADILETYPAVDPARVVVIPNGIDPDEYQPDPGTDLLTRLGIDPDRPSVVFVGRMTRQKGIDHALEAAVHIDPAAQVILCRGGARHARDRRRAAGPGGRHRRHPGQRGVGGGDGPPHHAGADPQPRVGVPVPVGLRAVRDHQPGGHGLRGAGGGQRGRRHPRGGGRRGDGLPRADRGRRARGCRSTPPASPATWPPG